VDVEKMKRINEMTAELKKHKAMFGDDAVKHAESIVLNEESGEKLPEVPEAPEAKSAVSSQDNKSGTAVKYHDGKMKEEIDLLRKGLLQLNDEFKEMGEEIRNKFAYIESRIQMISNMNPGSSASSESDVETEQDMDIGVRKQTGVEGADISGSDSSVKETRSAAEPVQNEQQDIPEMKKEGKKEEGHKVEKKESPSQNGYTSEDVAVDKVFYFGKK